MPGVYRLFYLRLFLAEVLENSAPKNGPVVRTDSLLEQRGFETAVSSD